MKTKLTTALLMSLSLVGMGANAALAQKSDTAAKTQAEKVMAADPHQVLAMAYHESMLTFAKALHLQTVGVGAVNVGFARSAVEEMRRDFDKMKSHNEAYMKTISADVRAKSATTMQEIETQRADLNTQLTALEKAVQMDIPDPKTVATLAASINTHLDDMTKAHKSQSDKMTMKN